MLSQFASQFPLPWLSCLGLLLFLAVFLGVLAWVHRKGSAELYEQLAHAPMDMTLQDRGEKV